MTIDPTRCTWCGTRFPPSCVTFDVTLPRSGQAGADTRLPFCDELCGGRWAVVEQGRLRGWLQRIVARTRGAAVGLASQALHSSWNVGGTPPTTEKNDAEEDC